MAAKWGYKLVAMRPGHVHVFINVVQSVYGYSGKIMIFQIFPIVSTFSAKYKSISFNVDVVTTNWLTVFCASYFPYISRRQKLPFNE